MENKKLCLITYNKQYILNFRMALNNKTLNATCNLDGYLFCRMPGDTIEVEIKVKTKWESKPCFKTLIPALKSSTPETGQIEEAACALGGGEHPKEWCIVAMIIQHQKQMFQWEKG